MAVAVTVTVTVAIAIAVAVTDAAVGGRRPGLGSRPVGALAPAPCARHRPPQAQPSTTRTPSGASTVTVPSAVTVMSRRAPAIRRSVSVSGP
ncbi:hypothetical protein P3T26_007733 [Streptomyces sp. MAA16]|nr:hypothetical protein [Streptomyces sp. MAA16]